jgi:hypothetical protein
LVEISIPPYDWIPNAYSFVPIQAFETFQSMLQKKHIVDKGHYTYVVERNISTFTYNIGKHEGSITFSTLINGSMKQQDVFALLAHYDIAGKEKVSV